MEKFFAVHGEYWKNRAFLVSSGIGFVFFLVSLIANREATIYATEQAGGSVSDIILSNIPVFNVDPIVNEGALLFFVFVLVLLALEPRRIAFTLKAAALFIVIRSLFIVLTHIGPFPEHSYIEVDSLMSSFNVGGDLFFSGHTGLPFLIALIFWKHRFARRVALGASVLFGSAVLLGHLHYSIDVFSAFFITYAIFHIAIRFFPRDHALCCGSDRM